MIEEYRRLFVNRDDVFAQQQSSGAYLPVKRPIEDHDIAAHLRGEVSYGVYVIEPALVEAHGGDIGACELTQTVTSVVFDLDTYDADALDWLTRAVERLVAPESPAAQGRERLQCLLLEDSGGKGYHIWLLLSEPVAAAKVRAWTEGIRDGYAAANELATRAVHGVNGFASLVRPALEIFPKQDAVEEGGFGNLVKLPLGRHAKSHATSYFVLRHGWATRVEDVVPFPAELIPEPKPVEARSRPLGAQGEAVAPFACIARILDEGAGTGQRDMALYHFARYAVSCGLPAELVLEWAEVVNEGFDPPLSANEVRTKVRSALHARAANPGCSAEWLRDYCPGGSRCFAPWNSERPSRSRGISDDSPDAWLSPDERRRKREGS